MVSAMSMNFPEEVKSGVDVRKTNHKEAEQRRRDSMKQLFIELRDLLPSTTERNLSKIQLLDKGN
jgi:hypothetical protein